MSRRKINNNHIRSLTKVSKGRSYSLTLPIEMVRELGWRERQKLVVKKRGNKLTIEDWG